MMNSPTRLALGLAVGLALLGLPMPQLAQAQSAADSSAAGEKPALDEVVVTARKRSENLQCVMNLVNDDTIRNAQRFVDIGAVDASFMPVRAYLAYLPSERQVGLRLDYRFGGARR